MAGEKKKIGFRMIMMALLALTFASGLVAGAFMYATGKTEMLTPDISMVSHTEYRFGEPGQIIARLVDFQGDPIVVTSCNATILYPNKTTFVSSAGMTASAVPGDHYFNFTTPNGPEGIYEYQATCYYNPSKNASVTNSFHLSSALTGLSGNITQVNNNVLAVQGNLTLLSSQVSAVNASLAGQITSLSSQLNANTTSILTAISDVNGSLYAAIQNISATTNLTPVLDAIAALDASMAANFTYTNGLILGVNDSTQATFSIVNAKLDYINVTATDTYNAVVQVNDTTNSIYTYITTTLATNIDDILTNLGIINATVNRIETTTGQINSTVNTILDNQQNAVNMDVFSG